MTAAAFRLRDGDNVVYVMPFEDVPGRRVVYRQDIETFDTTRDTVPAQEARTLASRGSEVPLYETPAWADPAAPRTTATPPAPTQP